MKPWDVIVIGGVGAEMPAAIEVERAGLRCLILEVASLSGGATALSTGIFYAAGTPQQRDLGIVDSLDQMFNFTITLSRGAVRPGILRVICDQGAGVYSF